MLDAQQLVVLGRTVRAAQGAGLDLTAVRGHGDVRDGRVFRFTGAVGENGGVFVRLGEADGVQRLREGTDLVHLHEDGVGRASVDALLEELGVRHEEIVTHELRCCTELVRELLPGHPVAFGATVFDGDDRILGAEVRVEFHHFVTRQLAAAALLEDVGFVAGVEFRGGYVEGQEDVLACFVTGILHGGEDGFQRGFGAVELRSETTFVTDGGAEALLLQYALEGVEDLGDGLQTFAEGVEAMRHDHEFLEIDRGIGVRATVDDVGHGHREHLGVRSTEVFEDRLTEGGRSGLGVGEGDGQDGVRAELGLRFGAIDVQHDAVHRELVEGVEADEFRGDLGGDVLDGLAHALAEIALLVAVAEFDGFVLARAGAGGHRSATGGAAFEDHINFNSGIAAGIKDFAGLDFNDGCHIQSLIKQNVRVW